MDNEANVGSLDHVTVVASNVTRTAQFYEEVLGFKRAKTPPFNYAAQWMEIGDGMQMHIVEPAKNSVRKPDYFVHRKIISRDPHFAFPVRDIGQVVATLQHQQIAFHREQLGGTDIQQLFFHDPDGNLIELFVG